MWVQIIFLIDYFFRAVVHSKKLSGKYRVPIYSLPLYSLPPPLSTAASEGDICYMRWPTLTHNFHPMPTVYIRGHSCCCIPAGLDKCMITHPYGSRQKNVTTLRILCALCIHPSFPPTLGNHCSFYSLHSFVFSKCHIIGFIYYVGFSYWFLSLSKVCFFLVCLPFDSSFVFSVE